MIEERWVSFPEPLVYEFAALDGGDVRLVWLGALWLTSPVQPEPFTTSFPCREDPTGNPELMAMYRERHHEMLEEAAQRRGKR